ncbi:hypothetical protein [Paenibacillus sp. FSL R10-2734]|uniref:hypothetical protein n=1 Tax=Paenibacillus sp. FSL R10-2734 TaxID=2954691 RepID=UPI0030DD2332
MSDINIRVLLYKLNKTWKSFNSTRARPQVYIFLTSPNPIQERILLDRGITPIVSKDPDPQKGTIAFFGTLFEQTSRIGEGSKKREFHIEGTIEG